MGEFWKSAGMHLVTVNDDGWLEVSADLLRAYFSRPELQPVAESCAEEIRLNDDLIADPFLEFSDSRLDLIADKDAADNYRAVLKYRAQLVEAGTVEGAYLGMMRAGNVAVPPLFVDQMVHLILRNILDECRDPLRLRAAEIFFRAQNVSTEGGNVMLADEETVEMYARTGGAGALGQLLVDTGTPVKSVELDVLTQANKDIYWQRSDRFDTVVDFRSTEPVLDAFARVLEAWVRHFLRIGVRVQPHDSIVDEHWGWHIGLDRESSRLLNDLYRGKEISLDDNLSLIALFQLEFEYSNVVIDAMRGKPVYLGLAMTAGKKLRMKPQNLLTNLPLHEQS